ncbi:hypothetical protein [Massilia sp. TSP1-1-2]|uniref:hypothetical protein n=1 Tax=Massilia sp. TSP1-1-2 TaxID=2804649 RepID=UPI003CEC4A2F
MTRATAPSTIALHSIKIASPCTASWAAMRGDDRVRHCNDCNKSVFNLSAMPEAEGAALLAANADGALCVRYYQRADGTVMTSDCSTSARAYTRRTLRKLPALAGAAIVAMSAGGGATAQSIPPTPPRDVATIMMGAPMPTATTTVTVPVPAQAVRPPLAVASTVAPNPYIMGKPSFDRNKEPAIKDKEPVPPAL